MGVRHDRRSPPHPLPNLRVPSDPSPFRASPTQRNLLRGGRVAEGIDEMTHEEMAQAVEHQRLSLTPGSKAYKALTEAAAALRRLDMARSFTVPDTGIKIEARHCEDRRTRWAVVRNEYCLTKSGAWEYEPLPSSRTADFIAATRFDTIDEAFAAAEKAV